MFGRRRKEKAKEVYAHRVWSLDHVISRSKPSGKKGAAKSRHAKKMSRKPLQKPKYRRPRGKVLTRKDDLDALLKMEEELAKEETKKTRRTGRKPKKPEEQALAGRDDIDSLLNVEETLTRKEKKPEKEKKKGKGVLHFLKPKLRKPEGEEAGEQEPAPAAKPLAKRGQIKTQIDDMVKMVTEKKKVKVDYIAKKLKVPESKVMEWAEILESDSMITIHYPAFGKPELRVKEAG